MKVGKVTGWIVALTAGVVLAGCQAAPDPEPPATSTTIIHDKTPENKTVIVNPPDKSTHTDTHTSTTQTVPVPSSTGSTGTDGSTPPATPPTTTTTTTTGTTGT